MNTPLSYHAYHLALLQSLYDTLRAQSALLEQVPEESNELFMERFDELLAELEKGDHDSLYLGQDILCQIISRYPQIAHLIPRDLLWYFGGDCLHFMPDDEIAQYQLLDEHRADVEARGEVFDWQQARQLLQSPT
ncbi:PA2817 family protein [Pseudomonas neustonica]|mgnify:CR=1|uniref:Dehydrogenase n=1 Tax=Pseudomonas neustonica TaxID=2487346 RepID=A0ABX9XJF1_9PSED|nr:MULTISPECIES: PA2817 family protein [Pseudomonas]MBA6421182.1 dehydrogenase [Pseudomonas sp. 5Ae-yellow]ROZ83859.1 dehydrogenase [Pseudomonas sp. SSM44]ROZ85914.1 dehydrogenase [Pseudomonas neustonica]|tara:strand:- start:132 stop:536 length:405 start_codon:yes stop_codon:yes gene_type:complete